MMVRSGREVIMKGFAYAWMTLVTVVLVMNSVLGLAQSKPAAPSENEIQDMARSMGMDPQRCDALQNRINQVTLAADSSLSEKEKAARLSELLDQAIESMREAASKDPEVARIVNQYLSMMQGLVDAARNTGSDKNVSSNTAEDLSKLKVMTRTYVQMIKMMCPKLKLPESVDK